MPSPDRLKTLRRLLLAKAGVGLVVFGGVVAASALGARGLTLGEWQAELRRTDEPRLSWRSIDKKHWQAVAPGGGEPPEVTDAREGTGAGCPTGMVRVKGMARRELHGEMTGEIERLQDAACTDWISRDFPARCRRYDRDKIAAEIAKLPTAPMDFCMDRFEYPNVAGEYPMIVVTYREADALCKQGGKRLCTESEWTFACEGEEVRPYPYGWERDTTACVIDRAWRPFKEGALYPRDADKARLELDRLWQGEPSGSRNGCRSPFGVYDMTGNVDEWTTNVRKTGYASVLKGGYWGPVRARCRPATRAHDEDFVAYQQSFRCCAGASAAVPAPAPTAARTADAGPAADAGVAFADRPSADLTPEWGGPGDDDGRDELDALAKARAGLGCATPRGRAPGPGLALAALALAALAARSRRRA